VQDLNAGSKTIPLSEGAALSRLFLLLQWPKEIISMEEEFPILAPRRGYLKVKQAGQKCLVPSDPRAAEGLCWEAHGQPEHTPQPELQNAVGINRILREQPSLQCSSL